MGFSPLAHYFTLISFRRVQVWTFFFSSSSFLFHGSFLQLIATFCSAYSVFMTELVLRVHLDRR